MSPIAAVAPCRATRYPKVVKRRRTSAASLGCPRPRRLIDRHPLAFREGETQALALRPPAGRSAATAVDPPAAQGDPNLGHSPWSWRDTGASPREMVNSPQGSGMARGAAPSELPRPGRVVA